MAERAESDEAGDEGFLGRWSRRKQEARTAEESTAEPLPVQSLPPEPSGEVERAERRMEEDAPAVPELPALDSLDAGSDYTGFLRREVPEEVRRQALRKAWSSDPVIAGFRGFADYDWDFNAPGYGALRQTDDIARLLEAVLPTRPQEEDGEGAAMAEGTVQETAQDASDDTAGAPTVPPLPIEDEGPDGPAEDRRSSLPRPALKAPLCADAADGQ
ncbi:DUF3306 domain-containing protein [Azospirillum thiophilum]|uniref:DUF3306 domain-containing protein n=1 Tax=Azospirillum thiophilum TaxID=528244 RepID=UPI000695DC2A|nr:DUF3306 domain-containing protein [Azospirillum thiophilum]